MNGRDAIVLNLLFTGNSCFLEGGISGSGHQISQKLKIPGNSEFSISIGFIKMEFPNLENRTDVPGEKTAIFPVLKVLQVLSSQSSYSSQCCQCTFIQKLVILLILFNKGEDLWKLY